MADGEWSLAGEGVSVRRFAPQEIRVLRVRGLDATRTAHLARVLGLAAGDLGSNRASGETPRVAWLAPGEWMVTGDGISGEELAELFDGHTWHLADVGDGRVAYAIEGPSARDLLSKGSSLDFHPRSFAIDSCAQTLFAQTRVLVERGAGEANFRLYADTSVGEHLQSWFSDALIEFG